MVQDLGCCTPTPIFHPLCRSFTCSSGEDLNRKREVSEVRDTEVSRHRSLTPTHDVRQATPDTETPVLATVAVESSGRQSVYEVVLDARHTVEIVETTSTEILGSSILQDPMVKGFHTGTKNKGTSIWK